MLYVLVHKMVHKTQPLTEVTKSMMTKKILVKLRLTPASKDQIPLGQISLGPLEEDTAPLYENPDEQIHDVEKLYPGLRTLAEKMLLQNMGYQDIMKTLDDLMVKAALEKTNGNVKAAKELLGVQIFEEKQIIERVARELAEASKA